MPKVIFAIGILIVLEGIVLLLRPDIYKRVLEYFVKGMILYLAGVLKIVFGIVFLISAMSCNIPWIIIAMGIIALAGGVWVFAVKLEKVQSMISWLLEKPPLAIRLLGGLALLFGGVIIWAA